MGRRTGDERHRLTVEPGLADHQARRNLDARPGVAQDVDRQQGAARDRIALDAELVIDPGKRRVDRRRRRQGRRRYGLVAQRAVFVDGKHNPAFGRRSRLCLDGRGSA